MKKIDEKHHIEVVNGKIEIIKTTNGQPIPEGEPTILFRGRDKLALPLLKYYRELCVEEGCTTYQLETMSKMITAFEVFAMTSPTMKQPGVTLGK